MDHELAAKELLAERYLLGELNANERADFEEHFFDCTECAASVRDGAAFLDSGKAFVRAGRRFRRWPVLTTWIPSAVAAALAVVVAVQNFVPRTTPQMPGMRVLHGIQLEPTRGEPVNIVHAGELALLNVNIAPDEPYPSYICELRDASSRVLKAQPVTKEEASQIVPLLLDPLPAGSYVVVVYGVPEGGNRREIARYPVNVVKGP